MKTKKPSRTYYLNGSSSQTIIVSRIKRIIEKYTDVWHVLHEPVQNSIDAIQKRKGMDEGTVDIKIFLKSQKIIISDNGHGFPKNLDLLLPDGTDKTEQSETMGYQGVGLKSVIYSTKSFKLLSNTGYDSWGIQIKNASDYIRTEGNAEAPMIELDEKLENQGTKIVIEFDDNIVTKALEQILDNVLRTESNFKWKWPEIEKTNHFLKKTKSKKEIFECIIKYYLTTQTYIGSISRLLNCRLKKSEEIYAKQVIVKLEIDFEGFNGDGIEDELFKKLIDEINKSRGKKISLEIKNKFNDFVEIIEEIKKKDPRSISFVNYDFDIKPAGIQNNPTLKDQVYCKIMTPSYTKDENNIEERFSQYISLLDTGYEHRREENIKRFKKFFPKILGIYILIGRMEYYERYLGNNHGIKIIAANGIPTQHELTARSSNQSFYFSPITFILNVDGKLNEGKTELISSYLKRQCVEFFREAFEATLNRLTKEFVRTVPNTLSPIETDLVDQPIINIEGIDIKRIPVDESTLIALFYQLLKHEKLSLPTYGLTSQGIFDGRYVNKDENIRSVNDLLLLEFKVTLSQLLKEFDSPNIPKEFRECDLVIIWDDRISTVQKQDWQVVNIKALPTANLANSNAPDWVTTFLKDKNHNYKPLVIVKDWVKELERNFNQ
ncbi:hypothetical protein ACFLRB_02940 [Acidobacteriota bacterium]